MNVSELGVFLRREMDMAVRELFRPRVAPAAEQREAELIRRASENAPARQFLESEPVREFMARAEAQLTNEMLSLPLDDDAGRRSLAVAIQTQRQLMKWLMAKAQDSVSAQAELERLKNGPRPYF